jgi:hypothetical protein
MSDSLFEEVRQRLRATERELEIEAERLLHEGRERFQYTLARGRVLFDRRFGSWLRNYRTGSLTMLRQAPIGHLLTAPVIYSLIFPLLLLDLMVSIYQLICFPVYGIQRVKRGDYLVIDRHHLPYLNLVERINCIYCSYGNGVIAYAREVAALTEQFWCPIKHARRQADPHRLSDRFLEYGDAAGYRRELPSIRDSLHERHGR